MEILKILKEILKFFMEILKILMKILKVLKEILKTNLIAEKEVGVWTSKLGETFNEGGHRPYVKK